MFHSEACPFIFCHESSFPDAPAPQDLNKSVHKDDFDEETGPMVQNIWLNKTKAAFRPDQASRRWAQGAGVSPRGPFVWHDHRLCALLAGLYMIGHRRHVGLSFSKSWLFFNFLIRQPLRFPPAVAWKHYPHSNDWEDWCFHHNAWFGLNAT